MPARGSLEKVVLCWTTFTGGPPCAGPPWGGANTPSWPRVTPGFPIRRTWGHTPATGLPERVKPEAGQSQGLLRPPQACLLGATSCTQAWGTVSRTDVAGAVLGEEGTGKAGLPASCCLGFALPVEQQVQQVLQTWDGHLPTLSDGQARVTPSGQTSGSPDISAPRGEPTRKSFHQQGG